MNEISQDLKAVASQLNDKAGPPSADKEAQVQKLAAKLESHLVNATWTLRRLPDAERGFLRLRTSLWPDTVSEQGNYGQQDLSYMQARRRIRIAPEEIDRMQPTLDLLRFLPDLVDRQILFWAAWHQDGQLQAKIPWAKVRRSMDCSLSRWTLKRRNENGLQWLANIILAQ